MEKRARKTIKPPPYQLSWKYRKVLRILLLTTKSGLPTNQTKIKELTKFHDQTIADIIFDLRNWGFMDKKEYLITEHHYKKLKPYLESDKKKDEDFHEFWSNLEKILIMFIILASTISLLESDRTFHYLIQKNISEYPAILNETVVGMRPIFRERECWKLEEIGGKNYRMRVSCPRPYPFFFKPTNR